MKLSDIMSGASLAGYAVVALVISFVAFVAVVLYVFSRRNAGRWKAIKQLPLEESGPRESAASGENQEQEP
jgi:hypothetical protein